MKKTINFKRFALYISVLTLLGGSAQAWASAGASTAGCGFNTAGDYLCEGSTLNTLPNPGQANVPSYGGPNDQNIEIPSRPPYTPGDLSPGIVVPYVPIIPIFTLPPTITLPGIPIIPIIQCNPEGDVPIRNPIPPTTPGGTGGCEDFYSALRQRESSGNYQARRSGSQYWGAYQMGRAARIDAGYGNVSAEQFMNNPQMQDQAIRAYHDRQWDYIKARGLDRYEGQTIGGRVMTRSAMIGGAHLMGVGGLEAYLRSNGTVVRSDGLGTQISEYMDRFGGYDITSCVN